MRSALRAVVLTILGSLAFGHLDPSCKLATIPEEGDLFLESGCNHMQSSNRIARPLRIVGGKSVKDFILDMKMTLLLFKLEPGIVLRFASLTMRHVVVSSAQISLLRPLALYLPSGAGISISDCIIITTCQTYAELNALFSGSAEASTIFADFCGPTARGRVFTEGKC